MFIATFSVMLFFLFFVIFWILGGVFFAILSVLLLGRIRKLRFSCLFSLWSLTCSFAGSYYATNSLKSILQSCQTDLNSTLKTFFLYFGCGFTELIGMFFISLGALMIGGWLILLISKSSKKPWVSFDPDVSSYDHVE